MPSAKRIQARLSFDPKLGPLWSWLNTLAEGERRIQLMFLIQLGFEAREGLRTGRRRQPSIDAGESGTDCANTELGTLVEPTSVQAAARALQSWSNLADMAAPPE